MALSKENIDSLFKFTRAHFVEWYDLQIELVDHLADDIEAIMEKSPSISFDEAKNQAFKKFGVFGFSDVVEKKQNALSKKYWKLVLSITLEYFKLPKIVLTAFLIMICYTFLHAISFKAYFIYVVSGILLISPIVIATLNRLKQKKTEKETGKKWMFENNISTLGGIYLISNFFIQTLIFIEDISWSIPTEIFTSIFIVLSLLLFYILIFIVPKKLRQEMAEQYSEYILVSKT